MNPNQFKMYYTGFEVSSDGGALPQKTVTVNATTYTTIPWVDTTGVDWENAIGYFDPSTTTEGLRSQFFTVRSASATQIILDAPLSELPVIGDTFRLAAGGRFRSSTPIPINTVDAKVVEIQTMALTIVTGVTIKQCCSEVDLYIKHTPLPTGPVLFLSTDGETWGTPLEVDVGVNDGYLQTTTGEWVSVDVTAGSLSVAETQEVLLVGPLWGALVPVVWMVSENQDSVVHHYAVAQNESDYDTDDVEVQCLTTVGSGEIATTYSRDVDDTLTLTNVDGLPGKDFWLFLNTSDGDLAYVTRRAGNTCYIADTFDWQEVPFDTGGNEPLIGGLVDADGRGGTLRALYLTSGSWAGGDAAGLMILSGCGLLLLNNDQIVQDSVNIALVAGGGVQTMRGFVRQSSWSIGESVLWYPPYDVVGIDPDNNNEFETVEDSQSILSGVVFPTWAYSAGEWIAGTFTAFGPWEQKQIIIRQYLLGDSQGALEIENTLSFDWN